MVPDCAETFIPLQHAISDQYFPSLLGGVVTVEEKRLLELPTYLAGLGIYDATETAVPIAISHSPLRVDKRVHN